MSYTRPNAYVNGTPISADDVRGNHESARLWLNSRLVVGDYAAGEVVWTALSPGMYASVVQEHHFVSGGIYTAFTDAEPTRWLITGQSVKQLGQDTALWFPLEAKRVYTRTNEMVMLTAWWNVLPRTNAVDPTDLGGADRVRILVDGELVPYIICDAYAMDTGSSNAGGTVTRARSGSISHLIEGLSEGWHTVELVVDSNHDLTICYSRSLTLEVLSA